MSSAALPPLVQDAGIPFDVFIQAITEQLDKAQAAMAVKARIAKLPLTFAVKDVALDLRAFVQIVDDDLYVRPAGPGDKDASTLRLGLTTITKPMIEENAVDFRAEDPKFSLREALGDKLSDADERRLERIGVRTVRQLTELKRSAGADVIARLARMPVNRLQQALLAAALPRVQSDVPATASPQPASNGSDAAPAPRLHLVLPGMAPNQIPQVTASGAEVPVAGVLADTLVLAPHAHQLGALADVRYPDGQHATVRLSDGSVGDWRGA
jgi:hypothetical protein